MTSDSNAMPPDLPQSPPPLPPQLPPLPAQPLSYASLGGPAAHANGPFLVVRKDADLPDRCIKCNQPAEGCSITKTVTWADIKENTSGGLFRLIIFVRMYYELENLYHFFAGLPTLTRAKVRVPVCRRHRRRMRIALTVAWLVFPLSLLAAWYASDTYLKIWLPVIGLAITTIAARVGRSVRAVHIGISHVTLDGVCAEFLASLEEAKPPSPSQAAVLDSIVATTDHLRERKGKQRR